MSDTGLSRSDEGDHIAILLCTYQGAAFIGAQIESITEQTHPDFTLWVSDDGSTDGTVELLQEFQSSWEPDKLIISHGPQKGFVANFLSLITDARITADYYALSDQDDIWHRNKLERALRWLKTIPRHKAALYCTRTRIIDSENNDIGYSPLFKKPPSFRNAVTQNIAGGNTMVMNAAAHKVLQAAGASQTTPLHDWWIYLVVSGSGGIVHYDPIPSLRYRQHANNIVGMNSTISAKLARIAALWNGRARENLRQNLTALSSIAPLLTSENQLIVAELLQISDRNLAGRLSTLARTRVYRQTLAGTFGLLFAAIFNRL